MCAAGSRMVTERVSSRKPPWLSGASEGQVVVPLATQKTLAYASRSCPLVADHVILYGSMSYTSTKESTSWSGCGGLTTNSTCGGGDAGGGGDGGGGGGDEGGGGGGDGGGDGGVDGGGGGGGGGGEGGGAGGSEGEGWPLQSMRMT